MSKEHVQTGMKVTAFGFKHLTDGLPFTNGHAAFVGLTGVISSIPNSVCAVVEFENKKQLSYPLSMVAEHLVGDEKDEAFKVGGTRLPETEAEVEHFDRTSELPVVTKEWLDNLGKEGDDFISQLHDSVSFDEFTFNDPKAEPMTEEQLDRETSEMYAQMAQEEKEIHQYNTALVNSFGDGAMADYTELVDVLSITDRIEAVDGPKGSPQPDDDIGMFTLIHVEQWPIGMDGDSWEGFMYANVHGKWYRIPYSC